MKRSTALTWSWLSILTKKRYDALLEVFGDLDKAFLELNESLLKNLGCREETVMKTINRLEEFNSEVYEEEHKKRGLSFLTIEDPEYPRLLKEIGDPPIFLYYKGELDVLNEPCVALVGTRAMSIYGKRVTEAIVPKLVSSGVVTVSGLAQGIDACVAIETVNAGGKTVAALGHGMAQIFPKSNGKLAERILENGGLLLSEFALDITPDKHTFPARNRIIAGLSVATVVLEAGEGSGALITSDLALDYGRDVFAVPGQIFDENYAGSHQEISRGHAKLISSAEEILTEIGIIASDSAPTSSKFNPKDDKEAAIFEALTTMPKSVGDIGEHSGLETHKVNATLTMLELKGAAKNVGSGQWVRS